MAPAKNNSPVYRYGIALACAVVIILRMAFPNLKFDNLSLWLFVIAVIALLVPDIGKLITGIRKLKKGDFEVEWGAELDELARKTSEVEERISEDPPYTYETSVDSEELRTRLGSLARDPRAGLVTLAVEIEAVLRNLARDLEPTNSKKYLPPIRIVDELAQRNIVPREVPSLFRDFWAVRNQAVHSLDYSPSKKQLYEILDIGIRLLWLLNLRRSPPEEA